jgi:hypothetical protein
MWSPPPESNRRPHPYHRWSARSGDTAAPRSALQNRKWLAGSTPEKWGAARRYGARLLANHWHACRSFVSLAGPGRAAMHDSRQLSRGCWCECRPGQRRSPSMPRRRTPTARSLAWCSASIWSAPDQSALLRLDASSIQTDPDGTRRIIWMIEQMIKGHPTQNRIVHRPASRTLGQRWQVALLVGPTLPVQACRDWRGRRRGEC